jgi:hypothetical protein
VTNEFSAQFDVSTDDQQSFMLLQDEPVSSELVVVTDWFEELRARDR